MRGQICVRPVLRGVSELAVLACVVVLWPVGAASAGVPPNAMGNLDCNHWSTI
jgi:hypothetical protein